MQLGIQNYIIIIPNLITSYIVYKGMTLHKITEFYTEWFSICANITSKFCTTAIFKCSNKWNDDLNKICKIKHDFLMFNRLISLQKQSH
jgi:hypothetical protein